MSQFRLLTAIVFAAVWCWNCSKLPEPPYVSADPSAQYAYFPLETGRYVDYRVDSVVYDFGPGGSTVRDSFQVFAREVVTDTLRDNTGQLVYRIERFERKNDTLPWEFRQNIFAARTPSQAIRTENNLRFLKLVFPFDRRSNWNGNLWIDQYREIEVAGERLQPFVNWRYEVDSLDIPAQIGAFSFDSVLVVTEVDESNAIERRLSRVKYAKHVGVVFREQWILDSQYCNQIPPPADCLTKPWMEKAEKGYILRQIITHHN
ncbi:MAG: hypothetical protein L6Q97_00565 [Thermoanaerobaculia bacterium]|nr:hypothetical protein [Thermoanaerobaculia bacterium]